MLLNVGDTIDFLVGPGSNTAGIGSEAFVQATLTWVAPTNPSGPPVIVVQPQSQTINAGQSATSVGVSSDRLPSPVTYQW